jgi:folate-binding protein YgfZ
MFDVSNYGRLSVRGDDALDLLNRLSTNDLELMRPGGGMETVLTTNKGRIIDLLRILHMGDHLLMLTSPGTQDRVVEWIDFYTFAEDITVTDIAPDTSHFLFVGDAAGDALSEAGFGAWGLTTPLSHTASEIGDGVIVIVRTESGSLPAWEVIVPRGQDIPSDGIEKPGTSALEMLRIEQGIPAFPSELNESHNPLEANLKPHISFNKGCYIGQEVVARLNTYDRVQRFLCRLVVEDTITLEPGSALTVDGDSAGEVTSSIPGFALAYLRKRFYEEGATVQVQHATGSVPATVSDLRPPEDD